AGGSSPSRGSGARRRPGSRRPRCAGRRRASTRAAGRCRRRRAPGVGRSGPPGSGAWPRLPRCNSRSYWRHALKSSGMIEQLHKSGVSVAELVEATALGRAELRAGGVGFGREVERVQWMEVLDDFADYLAPGDLLLTTAYNLGDDPALQRTLAGRMVEAGAVAMVVKCGYYLESVPYVMRRQADESDLPVFELPREVPFVEISQSIYEQLVSGSYERLQRSAGIHSELVRLVVDVADLGTVVRRAAAMLGNPVVVEDDAGRRLGGWRPDGRPPWLGPRRVPGAAGARGAPRAVWLTRRGRGSCRSWRVASPTAGWASFPNGRPRRTTCRRSSRWRPWS